MTAAPGPYTVSASPTGLWAEIRDAEGISILTVRIGSENPNGLDTARLLAASWKMRELLREAGDSVGNFIDEMVAEGYGMNAEKDLASRIRAALAEADGVTA